MTTCTNWGALLTGAFCQACGQKRFVESDRRFGHLLQQFLASATDVDGRVWRSVLALLFRPGLLSHEYFIGRRVRWLSPISLFLAINVVYFIAPVRGSDVALLFSQQVNGTIRAQAADAQTTPSAEQRAATGQMHTRFTLPWVEARVRERNEAALKASNGVSGYTFRDQRIAYDAKADDVSKALVILHVPFTALVLMLIFVFARQRHYFAEHFVFALHFFAFLLASLQIVVHGYALLKFALPAALLPPEALLDWLMRALLPTYAVLALRRAYLLGWLPSLAAAAVMLAGVVAFNLYVYRAVQFLVTIALT
ncbi:MAG: DUF3667 domain-containing protein [Dokdonella sp.]